MVYRRRRAERPRERGLRVAGLVGTLLVHLAVLFGAILGPAYDLRPPHHETPALQVRLIERPTPPPPPPVHGTPPRRVGPRHRGHVATARPQPRRVAGAPPTAPKPVKAEAALPAITLPRPPATIRIQQPAAPRPAPSLPHPRVAVSQLPVPPAGAPPRIELATPPVPRPVPPRFQPEPVRKPQLEGNRPMPSPPSLAMPELPAQSAAPVQAPTIAVEAPPRPTMERPSLVATAPVEPAPAPAEPQLEPAPLAAPQAPAVQVQAPPAAPSPVVPREAPRVQAPAIELAQPTLAPVPLETAAAPAVEPPAAAAVQAPALPSLVPARIAAPSAPTAAETAATGTAAPPQPAPASAASAPAPAASVAAPPTPEPEPGPSRAPEALASGSDQGVPGASASATPRATAGAPHGEVAPHHGEGQGEGRQGRNRPGANQGELQGMRGSYVQLQPHGDTRIMRHSAPDIGYRPTRFEQDWAPENESSVDEALRHAVEKTTVKHTFHLPRGTRVECGVSPLFPIGLLGCHNPDPPARPIDPKEYARLHLPPPKPLAPVAAASVATAASAPAVAASAAPPVQLDNTAQCVAARVAGAPLPPGCPVEAKPVRPAQPAHGSSSWVPASDQW